MLIGVINRASPLVPLQSTTQDPQGDGGGLCNAIIGTVVLAFGITLVGSTVSMLGWDLPA
ncbi:hypothetical protein [Mycobacterium lepromatosis]|uniref:hypothetical protein n=1 Tax=Mycobacterium lepromatosis TaxID=480418 RepID=UPI0005F79066|nr:hypothetical protein [Mycobacterium lepromatosis]